MVLLIDNYDSFTFNLVQLIHGLGAEVRVVRNDAVDSAAIRASGASHVVISPGPGAPDGAGVSVSAVRDATVPLLGVCLGHQCIAAAFGGRVVRAVRPVHGHDAAISHDGRGLFAGVPQGFRAARYHSLLVDEGTLPAELEVTARTLEGNGVEGGLLMALRHRTRPVFGVQFHPESVLTHEGQKLVANFLGDHCT